jgi:hypothetical protein
MGYSGGFGMLFPVSSQFDWNLNLESLFLYPAVSGMVVALPQLAKVFFEFGDS